MAGNGETRHGEARHGEERHGETRHGEERHGESGGHYGGVEVHQELWRVHGNEAQMVDMSENGPLSPATDNKVDNESSSEGERRWPNAPGYVGDENHGGVGERFLGGLDGAGLAGDPREGWQVGDVPEGYNAETRKPDLVGY